LRRLEKAIDLVVVFPASEIRMAESPDTAAGSEPSMEEILASIRKIISDEEPAAAAAGAAPAAGADDVIELTQMVQEDGSVVDIKAAPPEEKPMAEAKPPQPAPAPEPAKAEAPKAPPPAPAAPAPEKSTLVSEPAASKSASALSSLASTVEIERLATTPQMATALGNGARTLEDMVLEMLRPLLKDWLDKNLPGTVDRLVQKEIERIARKAQD
jgi:cell pole-organizing protein PopZ